MINGHIFSGLSGINMEITNQELVTYLAWKFDKQAMDHNSNRADKHEGLLWEINGGDFIVEDFDYFPFERGDLVAYLSKDDGNYWFRVYAPDKKTKHIITDAKSILWFCNQINLGTDPIRMNSSLSRRKGVRFILMTEIWKMRAEANRLISLSLLNRLNNITKLGQVHNDRALERLILVGD